VSENNKRKMKGQLVTPRSLKEICSFNGTYLQNSSDSSVILTIYLEMKEEVDENRRRRRNMR